MTWEIVVGIETHTQLLTQSKIFSGASTAFGAAPNTQACAVDIALPGVLPVLNARAVEHAVRFGLAIGATVSRRSVFARKNYFYPDLPKGYQISQYEIPVVQGGALKIVTSEGEKTIRITRAHLEEDAGKSLHEDFHGMSGIDLNRAGTPPLVRWIGICDGNMQEGSFRCDANVSVRKAGDAKLGTRCEIKNLNSFRFMEHAIDFEARRQIELIEDGGTVVQETRLYDADKNETRSMRSKEDAQDYRYFPDPDLLPLVISEQDIEKVRQSMPELPAARFKRFTDELAIAAPTAQVLTSDKELSDYFEETTRNASPEVVRQAANWIAVSTNAMLNERNISIAEAPVRPRQLRQLMERIVDGTISGKIAKEVDEAMWTDGGSPDEIIEKKGLKQISDSGAVEKIVDEVMAAGAKLVADYRSGKEKAFNALVGQVMKASKGKANPAQVNEILRRKLTG
jgi:aspartyl-tRNA(Asn)/glutamyl-tRNA(Gln) amidotransferase subunit B